MPLFTVTMKSNGSTNEKGRLSRAIHAASIAAGYPEDDLFQRFLSLEPSDLGVDLYYPALPKPRTDQMLMIEVLVSSGTDTNRKKGLVSALVEKLGEAGIDPNDIMVFFSETDRASAEPECPRSFRHTIINSSVSALACRMSRSPSRGATPTM